VSLDVRLVIGGAVSITTGVGSDITVTANTSCAYFVLN
jgi:hypothetical protein